MLACQICFHYLCHDCVRGYYPQYYFIYLFLKNDFIIISTIFYEQSKRYNIYIYINIIIFTENIISNSIQFYNDIPFFLLN
jgi:hypothetical protein